MSTSTRIPRLPFFLATLGSGLIGAIVALAVAGNFNALPATRAPADFVKLAKLSATEYAGATWTVAKPDIAGRCFADDAAREDTVAFFGDIAGSRTLAESILKHSEEFSVPPTLAFALAYEESRYDAFAINRNYDSLDRGLFQLNSKAFPGLTPNGFFDPNLNVRYGVAHLAYCLEQGGNEVAALAMYNAGPFRVNSGGTPKRTLNYIFRITSYRDNLDALFEAKVAAKYGRHNGGKSIAATPRNRIALD